ncbi:hypothetical protein DAPPUDRAFT_300897 [Daphnia pulex]|uniref:Uncharacterized protein n=1 Tax=Daphnia pulex TaxID=6669 RepID=E9HF79_DAPPU|nr:hypothetical protein DAPPUDRAFT_300897 [Daphnia pulex]|eukprot:EFX69563.1 hypothetical protein DAPPUDRAFT_300897 [Daphnia pulex]
MTTPAASKPSTEQFSRILFAKLRQGPVNVQLVSRLLKRISSTRRAPRHQKNVQSGRTDELSEKTT